jgi:hypothetical protein
VKESNAASETLLPTSAGFPAIFIFGTIAYAGIMWRVANPRIWRIGTGIYLPLALAFTIYAALFQGPDALIWPVLAGITALTYSVGVRWWCRVRLGYTGPFVENVIYAKSRKQHWESTDVPRQ